MAVSSRHFHLSKEIFFLASMRFPLHGQGSQWERNCSNKNISTEYLLNTLRTNKLGNSRCPRALSDRTRGFLTSLRDDISPPVSSGALFLYLHASLQGNEVQIEPCFPHTKAFLLRMRALLFYFIFSIISTNKVYPIVAFHEVSF